MVTQELITFIQQKLSSGESKEAITAELLKSNWAEVDIQQAFTSIESKLPIPPSPNLLQQQTTSVSIEKNTTHLIITVLGLLLFPLVGVICMWMWMKNWPKWVKILLSLPIIIIPIAILFGVALIFIIPSTQFKLANDTKRLADINTIENTLIQYQAANHGNLPIGISTTAAEIASGTGNADICSAIVPTYIKALPVDPNVNDGIQVTNCKSTYDTGYTISYVDGKVTVSAPKAEGKSAISVTR